MALDTTLKIIEKTTKIKAIDNLLKEIIKNNSTCATCKFNHDGLCFFAYPCVTKDFKYWRLNWE